MATVTLGGYGARCDWRIRQGASYTKDFTYRVKNGPPINLTGCTVRAKIRKTRSTTAAAVATFTCTLTNAVAGQFRIVITDEATAAIPCGDTEREAKSKYVWDCEIEFPDGSVKAILYGNVFVLGEATR